MESDLVRTRSDRGGLHTKELGYAIHWLFAPAFRDVEFRYDQVARYSPEYDGRSTPCWDQIQPRPFTNARLPGAPELGHHQRLRRRSSLPGGAGGMAALRWTWSSLSLRLLFSPPHSHLCGISRRPGLGGEQRRHGITERALAYRADPTQMIGRKPDEALLRCSRRDRPAVRQE